MVRAALYAVIALYQPSRHCPGPLSRAHVGHGRRHAVDGIPPSSPRACDGHTFPCHAVSATTAAATSGTRGHRLVMQDRTAQSARRRFLGAFLFSLVGIIALNTHLYGGWWPAGPAGRHADCHPAHRVMLLRWIDHLAGLGQVGRGRSNAWPTARRYRLACSARNPCLAAMPWTRFVGRAAVYPLEAGYLRISTSASYPAWRGPGSGPLIWQSGLAICSPSTPCSTCRESATAAQARRHHSGGAKKAFTLGRSRSFEQDPIWSERLSEIAVARPFSWHQSIRDPPPMSNRASTRLFCEYLRECESVAMVNPPGDRL